MTKIATPATPTPGVSTTLQQLNSQQMTTTSAPNWTADDKCNVHDSTFHYHATDVSDSDSILKKKQLVFDYSSRVVG